jgi:hypothetical protein
MARVIDRANPVPLNPVAMTEYPMYGMPVEVLGCPNRRAVVEDEEVFTIPPP